MSCGEDGYVNAIPFNTTTEFQKLQDEDKMYVEILLKMMIMLRGRSFVRR